MYESYERGRFTYLTHSMRNSDTPEIVRWTYYPERNVWEGEEDGHASTYTIPFLRELALYQNGGTRATPEPFAHRNYNYDLTHKA